MATVHVPWPRLLILVVAAVLSPLPASHAADPNAQSIVAAMRLAELMNYSWTNGVRDSSGHVAVLLEGQLTKDGYALVTYVATNAPGALRELAVVNGGAVSAIFKGNTKCVFETARGWRNPVELAARELAPPGINQTRRVRFSIDYPHEVVQTIIATAEKMETVGQVCRGTLSPAGAQQLYFPHFDASFVPKSMWASFVLTFERGRLTTIETHLEGTAESPRGDGAEFPVGRKTVYEIREMGTTRFDLPAEAKKKLDL